MVARSHQTLAEIPMLDKSEMEQLLVLWNRTDSPIVPDDPLFKSVAKHAARSPNATAVIAQDKVLTYAQLDSRANQLANYLIENGIGPGTAVGLYVERSTSMLVGIIGIQRAGGAYVPLDPAYPAERIALILEDAQIPVIVAQMDIIGQLPALDAEIIELDSSYECLDGVSTVAPNTVVTLDDLAYIIYTSGSTGKPKGVMVTQRNLLASTMAREAYYEEPVRRYLLLSSFAFDSSVAGIFWTLASGGALVLPAPDDEKDVRKLASLIANEKVTHTLSLPSLYRLLLAYAPPGSLESLQVVIVAGEACPPDMGERHFALLPETGLYNEYGPTEATVWCSVYNLPREGDGGPVPIGRPIANTKLFILDQREQPVPIGVPGELCVGGACLTAGYWNNAELTADRYPTLAFEGHKEIGRVYRTGDLARWRADGQIEYLGRVDNQVKIRGFRVELGEIEALLLRHPDVEEAVATVQELPGLNGSAERILVAYATGAWSEQGTNGEAAQLQAYLSERLPEYMVPRQVVWLPEMPHTPNGKVDRNRLPQSQIERDGKRPFIAPRNAVEETLVRIWREILRLPEIGIEDKFFELGGDSLKLIQVIARAGQEGLELAPRQLLEGQTIKGLAAIAANGVGPSKEPVLIPLNQEGTKSPVFFVHGISGSVVWLTNVLPLLKLDQPTFGLQSVGLQSGNEPDTSIEAMATRYLESVRRLQPSGPYYFGGFCFGGIVAYEMARQLEQLGERTALLAIIDAFPSQTVRRKRPLYDPLRLRIIRESAPYWFRGYKALGGWQRLRSRIFSKFDWDPGPQPDPDFEFEILAELDYMADYLATRREIQLQINDVNRRAQYEYEPQAYGGQITLFYPRLLGVGQALFGPIDPQREWSSLAKDGVSIRYVESSHVNLLRKPFVSDLAAQLNDALLSNQLMSRAKVEA
jgi:amino acid adenylation domain-containing protein